MSRPIRPRSIQIADPDSEDLFEMLEAVKELNQLEGLTNRPDRPNYNPAGDKWAYEPSDETLRFGGGSIPRDRLPQQWAAYETELDENQAIDFDNWENLAAGFPDTEGFNMEADHSRIKAMQGIGEGLGRQYNISGDSFELPRDPEHSLSVGQPHIEKDYEVLVGRPQVDPKSYEDLKRYLQGAEEEDPRDLEAILQSFMRR